MSKKSEGKKILALTVGIFLLILGVTLILTWWPDLIVLFRGAIGFVLALAGLLVLYSLNK